MATSKMLGRSQIDASDALHDFSCSPCSKDGNNSEALFHCDVCQMFYCQRCVAVHSKFTTNHNVTDKTSDKFGQGFRNTATSSSDLPTDVCEEHHGEVVKMFCPQHDVVCCTVCIAVKHRSCVGVEYIPNIARELLEKQGKEKTKRSLEKVKANLKKLKSKMQDDLRDVDKQRDDIIDDIHEFKERFITKVEELERTSLKEVKSKHKELADDINVYEKQINGLLKVIDKRLNKLTPTTDNNEAQQFVDVKNGEKESWQGADLVKQATSRSTKTMMFEINTDIDACLIKEQSLGCLKEWTASQTCVNIVCPVETEITNAFVRELQAQLKSHDVESEYTRPTKNVAGRYTIVLCAPDKEEKAVQRTRGIQDNTIILMKMGICRETCVDTIKPHKRNFKSEVEILCERDYNLPDSISFAWEGNKQIYEHVSNIVKGFNSSN